MAIPTEYQSLIDFISRWVKLSENDIHLLLPKLSLDTYKKTDVVVKQNQVCDSLRFVISGVYRVYQLKDGKEITSYFNYKTRNPILASFVSLLQQTPSTEIVECIVSGQVLTINYSDWKSLYLASESYNTFGRMMAEFNYVLAIQRIESLQFENATKRYEMFLKLYPKLLNMIPHHYIASYLGITPESLSRIRKSSMNQ